jgi:hypothetical protein
MSKKQILIFLFIALVGCILLHQVDNGQQHLSRQLRPRGALGPWDHCNDCLYIVGGAGTEERECTLPTHSFFPLRFTCFFATGASIGDLQAGCVLLTDWEK